MICVENVAINNLNKAIAIAWNLNVIDEAEFAVLEFKNGHRVNLRVGNMQNLI